MKSLKQIKDFSLQLGPGVTHDVIVIRLLTYIARIERLADQTKIPSRKIRKHEILNQKVNERRASCS